MAAPSAESADSSAVENDLRFLNSCLVDARAVHLLVMNSLTGTTPDTSQLLQEETQLYLQNLLQRFTTTVALRRRLVSGKSLLFLQCLTDADTRTDFVRAAANPAFVAAAR